MLILVCPSCDRFEEEITPAKTEAFIKYFGGSQRQAAVDLLQLEDNGYVILANSVSFVTGDGQVQSDTTEAVLIRTDAQGNEIWSRIYDTDPPGIPSNFQATAILQTEAGYTMLASQVNLDSSFIQLLFLDQQGNEISNRLTITDPINPMRNNIVGNDFELASDGVYWILATRSANTNPKAAVIRRTQDGLPPNGSGFRESDIFPPVNENDIGVKIVRSNARGPEEFYVLLNNQSSSLINGMRFTRLDETEGDGIAPEVIEVPEIGSNIVPIDLMVTGSTFVLLGNAQSADTYVLAGVNANAELIWSAVPRQDNTAGQLTARSFARSPLGIAVTGSINGENTGNNDIFLDQTSPFGQIVNFPDGEWPRIFGGANNDGSLAGKIIADKVVGLVLANSVTIEGDNELIALIKTNNEGLLE